MSMTCVLIGLDELKITLSSGTGYKAGITTAWAYCRVLNPSNNIHFKARYEYDGL